MNINRIPVAFYGKRRTVAPEIMYKFNQKQVLELQGIFGLPPYFRVDFANEGDALAKSVIGTPDGIEIPDEYLLTGKAIKVYIVLNGPDESVQTVAEIDIPVRGRLPVSEETPTPQEQSIIDSLIAALNEGVDRAETAADEAEQHEADAGADALKAEGYGAGTQDGTPVGSGSPYYHNNAPYFSDQASGKANEAAAEALKAEGWAEGTQNGTPVGSGSPYYHANGAYHVTESAANAQAAAQAKTGAETAQGKSETAQQKAETAQGKAEQAQGRAEAAEAGVNADALKAEGYAKGTQNGTPVGSGSPYYHDNSSYWSGQASEKATQAGQSAQEAEASKQAIQNMGANASTLPEGSSATVQKTVDPETGEVTLNFGIPKGDKGDKGDAATTVANILDTDTGKTYQISQSVVNGYLVETFTEVVSS